MGAHRPSFPVSAKPERRAGTWFERHPKKTIGFLLAGAALFLFLMLLLAEKLVEALAAPINYRASVKRYIRLREYPPFHIGFALSPNPHGAAGKIMHRIDEDGFIRPSKIHDQPDVNLVFLGGSTTECFNIAEDKRFPYLAGRLVEQQTRLKVNSYNAAMAGNNSLHSLNILLNKVIPLNPRFVLMMHNINDLVILLYEKSYWNKNKYKSPLVEFHPDLETAGKYLQESFHVLRNLLFPALYAHFKEWKKSFLGKGPQRGEPPDEFEAVRGKPVMVDRTRLEEEFRRNLETFIALCQARRMTPVLLTQASRLKENPDLEILKPIQARLEARQGVSYQQFRELFEGFNQTIRETGSRHGVLLIDLARQIPQEKDYLEDVVHLTERGSVLVAHLVSQALISQLK